MNIQKRIIETIGEDKIAQFDYIIITVSNEMLFLMKEKNNVDKYRPYILEKKLATHQYIIDYYNYLIDIKKNYINGEPDTFIEGACLCKALIQNMPVRFKIEDEQIPEQLSFINYRIALHSALKLISHPTVYKNRGNNPKELDYCDIRIPEGYIPEDSFEKRLISSIGLNHLYDKEIDTYMLSHILHLLYDYNINLRKKDNHFYKLNEEQKLLKYR